ncbi:MAG: hypothetical protein ABMB14_07760 [Myxococcota bacterium]
MTAAFVVGVFWSNHALACDGKTASGQPDPTCDHAEGGDPRHADANPAQCARQAELVGVENCAWTTAMMAQRVLEEGSPWTYVGRLLASDIVLPSKVAVPYTVGPVEPDGGAIYVVANEVLDRLVRDGSSQSRLELTGRLLEVDGVTYFVATNLSPARS